MKEFKSITFLPRAILQIGWKKYLLLNRLRILYDGQMLLENIMLKKLLERFTKKGCKRHINQSLKFKR